MVTLKSVYNKTTQGLKSNPVLFVPFAIFALCEFITLIIVYLAPRMPLKLVLGPPIRALWGERFLHYPVNFILIPKLISLARLGLTVLIGSLLTGAAAVLVLKIYKKSKIDFKTALKTAFKKYIALFGIVLLFTLIFFVIDKITSKLLIKYFTSGHTRLLFLGAKLWLGPILMTLNFIFALIVQSAFIYAIPILMIEGTSLTKAIIKSFQLFKQLFLKTLFLVGLPMLLYIPLIVLQSDSAFLITRLFPESVLLVSFAGLLISSLVIDLSITLTTTYLYLMHKDEQR
jgi:hypothetical protein